MSPDLALNTLLDTLLSCLARSGPRIVFGVDDLPDEAADGLATFNATGLIEPAEPARSIICEGCDRGCLMTVDIVGQAGGRGPSARIVCDKPESMGVVRVAVGTLARWAFSEAGIALVLARHLRTDRTPAKATGGVWQLGTIATAAGGRIDVALARTAVDAVDDTTLYVLLAEGGGDPSPGRGVSASRVLRFQDGVLVARRESLARHRAGVVGPGKAVVEISYESREVELVDRVADVRVTLVRPQFESTNDRLFDFLYHSAGRSWTDQELIAAGYTLPSDFPHGFIEALGFVGDLRRAFFEASKSSIMLRRSLTQEQLDALGLSIASLWAAWRMPRRSRSRPGNEGAVSSAKVTDGEQ